MDENMSTAFIAAHVTHICKIVTQWLNNGWSENFEIIKCVHV